MESTLYEVYSRLLADLVKQCKRPLIEAHYVVDDRWLLIEAPKLDKAMWAILEAQDDPKVKVIDVIDYLTGIDLGTHAQEIVAWLEETLDLYRQGKDITEDLRVAHQSLVFCYKVEYAPTNEQLKQAYTAFEENDTNIAVFDLHLEMGGSKDTVICTARSYISQVIHKAKWQEIAPSHGPGVTYPSAYPWEKSNFRSYYPSIDEVYPYSDYIIGLPHYWDRLLDNRHWADTSYSSIECKVSAVPKDSRGPRLICVHPAEAIWIQQGTRRVLEHAITTHRLTSGRINFSDQAVNGRLALKASQDREFVTLDLKDASDRLSNKLVRILFGEYAYRYLSCSRAVKARVGSRVIELNKFAPMGNCLTFPVQSLCYWAIVRAGIYHRYGVICNEVFVFGDDIIYPKRYHAGAHAALVRTGMIINANKTYVHGSFRESCGVDAWKGTDITPLRLRRIEVKSASDALAFCDLAKRARLRFASRLALFLYQKVEERFGRLSKTNDFFATGLIEWVDVGWDKLLTYEDKMRFNRNYHRWEVPVRLVMSTCKRLITHDWYHVQDSLIRMAALYGRYGVRPYIVLTPYEDTELRNVITEYSERGLEYPIPHRERLKCGWSPVIMS